MDKALLYEQDVYKRGISYMSPKNKEKIELEKVESEIETLSEKIQSISNGLNEKKRLPSRISEHPLVAVFLTALIGAVCWFFVTLWNLNGDVRELTAKIDKVSEQLDTTNKSIGKINDKIEKMQGTDVNLVTRLDSLEENFFDVFKVTMKDNEISFVHSSYDKRYELNSPTWGSADIIATDMNNGKEYSAEFLTGKKLLIPYTSENQEIVFYGQFNENNHWDKNCVINVYMNNELTLIMDAEYDDGTLVAYKQVMKDTTLGGDVWIVSEREHSEELNSGETWNYIREYGYYKKFELTEVKCEDVIYVDAFTTSINSRLDSYYCGNTSKGKYNDSTGNAYFVRYAKDGTVRTLYQGNFVDGKFNDDTGRAWYIVRDEDKNTNYMYFCGIFENNSPKKVGKYDFINPFSVEEILEFIKEKQFNCELNWYVEAN